MKKYLMFVLALMLLTSCSGQKQLNLLDKNANIDSITVSDYFPLFSSFLPEPTRLIDNKSEITFLKDTINRALLVEKTIEPKAPISDPDTFDYQLYISGNNIEIFPIYVLIEGDDIYLSSIDFYNSEKQEYVIYQIQSSDVDEFKGFLKALE